MPDSTKEAIKAWATPSILLACAAFLGVGFLDFRNQVLPIMSRLETTQAHMQADISAIRARENGYVTKDEMKLEIENAILKMQKK